MQVAGSEDGRAVEVERDRHATAVCPENENSEKAVMQNELDSPWPREREEELGLSTSTAYAREEARLYLGAQRGRDAEKIAKEY